jgi:hypothetical protein
MSESRLNYVLRVGATHAPANLSMNQTVTELPSTKLVPEKTGEQKDTTGEDAECCGMCAQICCFCCLP